MAYIFPIAIYLDTNMFNNIIIYINKKYIIYSKSDFDDNRLGTYNL